MIEGDGCGDSAPPMPTLRGRPVSRPHIAPIDDIGEFLLAQATGMGAALDSDHRVIGNLESNPLLRIVDVLLPTALVDASTAVGAPAGGGPQAAGALPSGRGDASGSFGRRHECWHWWTKCVIKTPVVTAAATALPTAPSMDSTEAASSADLTATSPGRAVAAALPALRLLLEGLAFEGASAPPAGFAVPWQDITFLYDGDPVDASRCAAAPVDGGAPVVVGASGSSPLRPLRSTLSRRALADSRAGGSPVPPASATAAPVAMANSEAPPPSLWYPVAYPTPCDSYVCPLLPRPFDEQNAAAVLRLMTERDGGGGGGGTRRTRDSVNSNQQRAAAEAAAPVIVDGMASYYVGLRFLPPSDAHSVAELTMVMRCYSVSSRDAVVRYLRQQLSLWHEAHPPPLLGASPSLDAPTSATPSPHLPWWVVAERMADGVFNRFSAMACGHGHHILAPPSTLGNRISAFVRSLVSRKKRRFQSGGFDLDLAYITPDIIAMGYPSSGKEAMYRNSMEETVRFFEERHAVVLGFPGGPRAAPVRQRCYRIYNLCSERWYPPTIFGGRFERFPSDDHCPPPLPELLAFCISAAAYMRDQPVVFAEGKSAGGFSSSETSAADGQVDWAGGSAPIPEVKAAAPGTRVVAVHCKAGKGRTGVMIIALLMFLGRCRTLADAMKLYSARRTRNSEGVTIASQRRFLQYFAHLLREVGCQLPRARPVQLQALTFRPAPHLDIDGGCTPFVRVRVRRPDHFHIPIGPRERRCDEAMVVVFDSRNNAALRQVIGNELCTLSLAGTQVVDEAEVVLYNAPANSIVQGRDEYLCSFWFHTSFVDGQRGALTLRKGELDGASKEMKDVFDNDFVLSLEFVPLVPQDRE